MCTVRELRILHTLCVFESAPQRGISCELCPLDVMRLSVSYVPSAAGQTLSVALGTGGGPESLYVDPFGAHHGVRSREDAGRRAAGSFRYRGPGTRHDHRRTQVIRGAPAHAREENHVLLPLNIAVTGNLEIVCRAV